jgi:hypothetical protein
MNRRSFLKILAGTAAASTTAYFLPPIGGWKSDVIAQPRQLQLEALNRTIRLLMARDAAASALDEIMPIPPATLRSFRVRFETSFPGRTAYVNID